jgi:hypothetical protein
MVQTGGFAGRVHRTRAAQNGVRPVGAGRLLDLGGDGDLRASEHGPGKTYVEKVDQEGLAETAMARLQRGTVENKVSHRARKSVSPSRKIS